MLFLNLKFEYLLTCSNTDRNLIIILFDFLLVIYIHILKLFFYTYLFPGCLQCLGKGWTKSRVWKLNEVTHRRARHSCLSGSALAGSWSQAQTNMQWRYSGKGRQVLITKYSSLVYPFTIQY